MPDDLVNALFIVTYAMYVDLLLEEAKSQLTKAEQAVLEESLLEQYGRWALNFAKQRENDGDAQERAFAARESGLITSARQLRDEKHCSIIDAYTAYLLQWETLRGLQPDVLRRYFEVKRDLFEGEGLPDKRGIPDRLRSALASTATR